MEAKMGMVKNGFYLIKNEKDFCEIKAQIADRGGINKIKITNQPQQFPVVMTYSLSNTIEGLIANIRHIAPQELIELIHE